MTSIAKFGFEQGKEWAAKQATPIQLERLESARHPVHGWYFEQGFSEYSPAERFFFLIEDLLRRMQKAHCHFGTK